jgi:hypothetical protein
MQAVLVVWSNNKYLLEISPAGVSKVSSALAEMECVLLAGSFCIDSCYCGPEPVLADLTCGCARQIKSNEKGTTLSALLPTLGIELDEMLAIGDGSNDVSMIKLAGLGVAMVRDPQNNIYIYIYIYVCMY